VPTSSEGNTARQTAGQTRPATPPPGAAEPTPSAPLPARTEAARTAAPDTAGRAGQTLSTHKPFEPKTGRESLYAGLKEGFNVMAGNMETDGIVAHVTGQKQSGEGYALEVLGGVLGGVRQGFFHALPVGERFGYRNQPENSPEILRWLSSTPLAWSYYAMYLTTKTAIMNGINGQTTPTELNLPHGDQEHP
jgi:hypothetical protein